MKQKNVTINRRTVLICVIIAIVSLICACLMRMLLRKYYFYCLDNEYSLAMIEKNLDHCFGDIEIRYLDKEMNVIKDDDGKYRFEYIATVTDGDVTFEVVQTMRDENINGGHLYKNEYELARNNYLRKKFEMQGIDIKPYEVDFREAVAKHEPDCEFYISKTEEDNEKVELMSTIMSEFIHNGMYNFWFEVYTDDGEEIIDSYRLMELYKEEQIDESDLQQFIKEKLELESR
ncbi:MAG: hypothetical protein U0K68_13170 [Agathobacter sp.]|nr:hypothetical protein [Agathobacter sp.]